MRLTWPQHLQAARALELAADTQRGYALALMGMALLILAEDLLEQDCRDAASQAPGAPLQDAG